jgi:hypothetical protein
MIEWEHLVLFCQGDEDFFTGPERLKDETTRLPLAGRQLPPGWAKSESQLWVRLRQSGRPMVETGWKIHVSATPGEADAVATAVWDYCAAHGIAFKFLRSTAAVELMNSKYADRSGSGKFMAVYPADEAELTAALEALGERLRGRTGPFILSDLRIGDGPLYVRYGAFTELTCLGAYGEPVLARRAPDGTLVPDEREPFFIVPDGVPVPAVLQPLLGPGRFRSCPRSTRRTGRPGSQRAAPRPVGGARPAVPRRVGISQYQAAAPVDGPGQRLRGHPARWKLRFRGGGSPLPFLETRRSQSPLMTKGGE